MGELVHDLPPDPSPRAWNKLERRRRARAGLKAAGVFLLVAGVLAGAGWGLSLVTERGTPISSSRSHVPSPSPSASSSPSPSPSPTPFKLGEIIRRIVDEQLSTSGLHALEPGDCFEIEWADSARTAVLAVKVPSCRYPHRYEFVYRGDFRRQFAGRTPSVAERRRVYTRACHDAVQRYTGVPVGRVDTPANPFSYLQYDHLEQPIDDFTVDCAVATSHRQPVRHSFRGWATRPK